MRNQISTLPIRNVKGELLYNVETLLSMAGYKPSECEPLWETWETRSELIFRLANGEVVEGPWSKAEVGQEVNRIIAQARQWVHQNLRAFKRHVKLTEWQAVQIWKFSSQAKFEVVHCKVDAEVEVFILDPQYQGWKRFETYGQFTEVKSETTNRGTYLTVKFDQGPAAIYVAVGDSINGGRTAYRKLYVAE